MTKQKAPVVDLPRALYMWRRSREHLPGRPPTTTIQRDLPPFEDPHKLSSTPCVIVLNSIITINTILISYFVRFDFNSNKIDRGFTC